MLLRSRKENGFPTRIDVLIQDVRALEIRCSFRGMKIESADMDYLKGFRSNPAETVEPGNRIYALRGSDWEGYIVGGLFACRRIGTGSSSAAAPKAR